MNPAMSKSTDTATDVSEMSEEDQITELLTQSGETGNIDEEAKADPVEDEATQEDEAEEDDQSETEESTQEAADDEDEETTWGKALGLDDEQIVLDEQGNFKGIKTKVEGEVQQVDLKELVKGYQLDQYNTNRSKAMAEERKQFEQYAEQQAQALQQRVQQAETLVSSLEQQLVGEYESVDWEQLRVADPAEYAARRQDFAVRYNQVKQMEAHAQEEHRALTEQQQQRQQQANYAHLQQEAQKALEIKPEWVDPDVRVKAMNDMGQFLQGKYGYGPDEVAGITDHRVIRLIEDAMAYQSIKKGSAPKLSKPVPKFQKPGSGKKSTTKQSQLNKLYKKAAASSNRELKDDAITQLLLNS